jgi:hypothetical protein
MYIKPVTGQIANVNGLRRPTHQMARLAPVVVPGMPGKLVGLSERIVPSELMRRILPGGC